MKVRDLIFKYGAGQGGGGAAPDPELTALLAKFTPTDTTARVGLVYVPALGYCLIQPLGNGRCAGYLIGKNMAVGNVAPGIESVIEFMAVRAVDNDGLTENGTFSTTNNAVYYGGTRRSSTTNGAYVELTTPDDTVDVGAFLATSINAGICLVTIDGDPTLASQLPTAQDLVDSGALAATALVANGGTLNPTDRVIDEYSNSTAGTTQDFFYFRYFAKNLTPGVHAVRMTRTGYKNTLAIGDALYVCGMFYRVDGETMPADPVMLLPGGSAISDVASRWEFAISVKPTGATAYEWMGHSNSEYNRIAPVFAVDGAPIAAFTDGYPRLGSTISATIDFYLRHPETGSTNVGLGVRTYTLSAAALRHAWQIEWQVGAQIDVAYPCMLPMVEAFDRGSMVGAEADYTLTSSIGIATPKVKSKAGYLWQSAGNWGCAVYLPDLSTVLDYAAPGTGMWIEDRASGLMNKVYVERNNQAINVAASDVWEADCRWLMMYFSGGAEAALARPA
jgi:hypothetical protein